jgi:hypothetical protein
MPTANPAICNNMIEAMQAIDDGARTVYVDADADNGIEIKSTECLVCKKEITPLKIAEFQNAIAIWNDTYVCSGECYVQYRKDSGYFFENILPDGRRLEAWGKGKSKVEIENIRDKGTHAEEIIRRLESI